MSLSLRAGSVSGGNESALGGLQEEEDKKKKEKGLVLGTGRDVSGSAIGLHLIPSSGIHVFDLEIGIVEIFFFFWFNIFEFLEVP